jgi:tetratricopeptide (TPR) repeat protein
MSPLCLLTLLLSVAPSAAAQAPDTPSAAAPLPAAPDTASNPTFSDRVNEAIAIRQRGDVEAARALLLALEPMVPDAERAWYLYQLGICEDLAHRPAEARVLYEQAIALHGEGALDARYRRVLVLEELGETDAALAEIRAIDLVKGLSDDDELIVALQRGMSELDAGRRRAGVRRIQAALDESEGTNRHNYVRAKARFFLARALLDEANALHLRGPEKRVVRNLKGRAERIKAAEAQIIALARLQEPEWVLASLIAFGDAHALLADELATSPPPKKLSAAEAEVYRRSVAEKAENVRTKAFHAYDQGVALAARLAWESPRVGELTARRNALAATR